MFNLKEFMNPPSDCYPAPFWFWNDQMPYEDLKWQLGQMKEQHIFEVFIHARKGLLVPYMSEEWLLKIEYAIQTAKELEMKIWIYDEDNFPSGYAGGAVLEDNPDFCGKNVRVTSMPADELASFGQKNKILAVFIKEGENYALLNQNEIDALAAPEHDASNIAVFSQNFTYWHPAYSDGFYIDVLNKDACQSFLNHTHRKYESRFADDFGKTVKGFFSDEAGFYNNLKLLPWSDQNDCDTIIWTDRFPEYFLKRNGYDIIGKLPCLFFNLEDSDFCRRDFYETACDMYLENFLVPQKDYCEERGMFFVGHLHMEDYLSYHVVAHGNFTRALNGLSYAGTDRIDQNNEKINEKVVSSFGHQYNKPRVLSETYALTSWALDFTEMRRIANYQYVRGINMIVQHAFYASIREERKWECPPSQFFQNPYWKHYSHFSDYIGRLSYALTCGTHHTDIAVYYPIANAQCRQTPFDWQCTEIHDMFLQNVAGSLLESQVDFDFINDEAFGQIGNGVLQVNDERYRVVLVPDVDYMPLQTLNGIADFCDNGGIAVFIRKFPVHCTEYGMQQAFEQRLERLKESQNASLLPNNLLYKAYTYKFSVRNLFEYTPLKDRISKEVVLGRDDKDIKYLHRRDGQRDIFFIINENASPTCHTITFNTIGTPTVLDPIDGQARSIGFTARDGKTSIDLTLRAYDGILVVFNLDVLPILSAEAVYRNAETKEIGYAFMLSLDNHRYGMPLRSWSEYGHPYFSGEGIYTAAISIDMGDASDDRTNARYFLSLGEVCDMAEVLVNQNTAGVLLYSPYMLDITGHLKDGVNTIEIRVINSLINEFEKKDKKSGLIGPVALKICR